MTNRRLPLLVERSVTEARLARTELAQEFETNLRLTAAQVSCEKGCHNCCYHPVYVSLLEGISLFQWLSDNGRWGKTTRDAFVAASQKTWNLAPEVWMLSLIPCPLLEKAGTCKAYDARPFACRITFSTGEPAACHPHALGPGMLPKKEAFEELARQETPLLARHYLTQFRLPLASAVLYGERIVRGDLELEDCRKALWEAPNG